MISSNVEVQSINVGEYNKVYFKFEDNKAFEVVKQAARIGKDMGIVEQILYKPGEAALLVITAPGTAGKAIETALVRHLLNRVEIHNKVAEQFRALCAQHSDEIVSKLLSQDSDESVDSMFEILTESLRKAKELAQENLERLTTEIIEGLSDNE